MICVSCKKFVAEDVKICPQCASPKLITIANMKLRIQTLYNEKDYDLALKYVDIYAAAVGKSNEIELVRYKIKRKKELFVKQEEERKKDIADKQETTGKTTVMDGINISHHNVDDFMHDLRSNIDPTSTDSKLDGSGKVDLSQTGEFAPLLNRAIPIFKEQPLPIDKGIKIKVKVSDEKDREDTNEIVVTRNEVEALLRQGAANTAKNGVPENERTIVTDDETPIYEIKAEDDSKADVSSPKPMPEESNLGIEEGMPYNASIEVAQEDVEPSYEVAKNIPSAHADKPIYEAKEWVPPKIEDFVNQAGAKTEKPRFTDDRKKPFNSGESKTKSSGFFSLPKLSRNQIGLIGIGMIAIGVTIYFTFFKGGDETDDALQQLTKPISQTHQPRTKANATQGRKTNAADTDKNQTTNQITADTISQNDKTFNDLFASAESFFRRGDYRSARNQLILARKLKLTDELLKFERQINDKLTELDTPVEPHALSQDQLRLKDGEAFDEALKTNSRHGYEEYMRIFPQGGHVNEALAKIKELQRKEKEDEDLQLKQQVRQQQKQKLRYFRQELGKADIDRICQSIDNSRNRLDKKIINNDTVFIDFSTGLMWLFWEKPMDFEKAKLWVARAFAGYRDWRLPTADEACSILRSDRSVIPQFLLQTLEFWTGDMDAENGNSAWVCHFVANSFVSVEITEFRYLIAVRTIE